MMRMRCCALIVFCTALVSCTSLLSSSSPRAAPQDASEPTLVEIPQGTCETTEDGRLWVEDSGLWFAHARDKKGSWRGECRDTAQDQRKASHAWEGLPILIGAVEAKLAALFPYPEKGYGTGLQLTPANELDSVNLNDRLVKLDLTTLEVNVVWRSGSRLMPIGMVGGRLLVVMVDHSTLEARFAILDPQNGLVTRTEVIEGLEESVRHGDRLETIGWAAPNGPNSFLVRCAVRGSVCSVRIVDDHISVERALVPGAIWLFHHGGRVLIRLEQGGCLSYQDEPVSSIAGMTPQSCPVGEEVLSRQGLWVDGAKNSPLPARVRSCLVETALELPSDASKALPGDMLSDGAPWPPASGLIELPQNDDTTRLHVLAFGRSLTLGYSARCHPYPDFLIALHSRQVTAYRTTFEGHPALRLQIGELPIDTGSDCVLGSLVARSLGHDFDVPTTSFLHKLFEFGVCE